MGTSFIPSRAQPSCVQQLDPIRSESTPGPQCLFKERTQIRPWWVLLISRVQGRGVPYARNLPLPGKCPQQIGDAAGHQGREDMEQGVDQRRANQVKEGGIR